jgi:hypothetical protein
MINKKGHVRGAREDLLRSRPAVRSTTRGAADPSPEPPESNSGEQQAAENDQNDADAAEADRNQGAWRAIRGGMVGNHDGDEHARYQGYAADRGQAHAQAGRPRPSWAMADTVHIVTITTASPSRTGQRHGTCLRSSATRRTLKAELSVSWSACGWSWSSHSEYDPGMSGRKARLTITVDPDLSSYAERLVESGHAASVSAAFNEAMAEKAYRDRRRRGLWKARSDQADPARVARLMAHVDQQLTGE